MATRFLDSLASLTTTNAPPPYPSHEIVSGRGAKATGLVLTLMPKLTQIVKLDFSGQISTDFEL